MLTRRTSIILLTFVASFAGDRYTEAGCCDWLFGRSEPAYAVGYTPYAVSYAPAVAAQPVVTQRVAIPVAQPVTAPLTTGGPTSVATVNGAYQAQRPSYDNPSVYSGMPVIMAPGPTQTSYRAPLTTAVVPQAAPTVSAYRPVIQAYQPPNVVPLTRNLRGGAAATSNPIYGTGNIYPNNYQVTRYQAAYPATTPAPVATTTAPVVATAAAPVATAALPVYQAPPRKSCCCGLSRFFGSCWGKTKYQTTYYRAPITYYRPVTSVDPVSGTTVTVQQPCTSTVQQLQRTPYNVPFTQSAPMVAPVPGSSCGAGCSTPNTYLGPSVTTPAVPTYGGTQTYGGVGQTSGIASPSDQSVMPIPSTEPSYQQQPSYTPNTQPLQGSPSNGGDLQRVPQPRMESTRPKIETETDVKEDDDSYWGSRDKDERTASNSLQPTGGVNANANNYSQLRPIEAPGDYQSPMVQHSRTPSTSPTQTQNLLAPPLLPRPSSQDFNLRGTNSTSLRVSVPVREATLMRSRNVSPAIRVRDTGGWQAND